jgi:HlyD family secretion protein
VRLLIAIIVTFVVTAIIAAGVYLFVIARGGVGQDEATKVRIENPEVGNLTETVSARAEVEPKTKVDISARVSARIVALPFDEGDNVTKGSPDAEPPVPASVLVRLDSTDLEAALKSSEARRNAQEAQIEVEKARLAGQRKEAVALEASLDEAKRDLERNRKLLATKDVSRATVENTQTTVAELDARLAAAQDMTRASELTLIVLQHNLEAADADIDRARDNLSYTTIVSPINGTVTRVHAEVGEQVIPGTMNNPGTVILQAADLTKMLLVAQVDETDVGRVRVGQRATAEIHAYPDEEFEGTVDSIALTHDYGPGGTKYYKTEILLKLDGRRIYSGATADVDIETKYYKDVIRVPSQAVLERPVDELPVNVRDGSPNVDLEKTYATVVYRLIDGKAVVTPVRIGPSDATHTVIEDGLSVEDRIVTGPYKELEALKHDQAIVDEREAAEAEAATKPEGAEPHGDPPVE